MKKHPKWISKSENQKILQLLVLILATVFGGAWAVYIYINPSTQPERLSTISVENMQGGYVAGHDQNVLNIIGISEERFQSISEESGVTKAALRNFFKIMEQKNVPPEELDNTLRQIARRYNDLKNQLESFTSENPEVVTLKSQAIAAMQLGDFGRAEVLLNEARKKELSDAQQFRELAHVKTLSAANIAAQTAQLKITQLDYIEAAEYYRQASDLVPDGEEKYLAALLNERAVALFEGGMYDQAEPLYEQALDLSIRALGPENMKVAIVLNNLATLYQLEGKFDLAESYYKRSLTIREKILGPNDLSVATCLDNLATSYSHRENYADAEPLYLRALAIREKVGGPDHPDVAVSLNNLGTLYIRQAKYAVAEPLFQRALGIWEKVLGPENPSVAACLLNLGNLHSGQGKYVEAEQNYLRSMEMRNKVLGPDHPDNAGNLNGLARIYDKQGKYVQSESFYKRMLELLYKKVGADHPDVATTYNNMASLYAHQGKYDLAEINYNRSLEITEKTLGAENATMARRLRNLAYVYHKTGRDAEAAALEQRASHIRDPL